MAATAVADLFSMHLGDEGRKKVDAKWESL